MGALKDSLDRANPNTLADGLRKVAIGRALAGGLFQKLRRVNPDVAGADPYNLATVDVIKLPENAKAERDSRGHPRRCCGCR